MNQEMLEKTIEDQLIQRILTVLAEVNEATPYQIEKRTEMPHATVHKKIDQALKANLIRVKKEGKFRTGLQTRTYELTPYGLIVYLNNYFNDCFINKKKPEITKEISEKINELLFKKWKAFLRYVPEGYALALLSRIVDVLCLRAYKNTEQLFLEEFIAWLGVPTIREPLIWEEGYFPADEVIAFLDSEPELKETFSKQINEEIEGLKVMLTHWQGIREKIHKPVKKAAKKPAKQAT
jgi:DNA-binding transcriptional ArsR family regulator